MINLKSRIKALESAVPKKVWFCIDVVAEPTQNEWEQINTAHAEGRIAYVFRQDATIGCWMPNAPQICWSDEL